MKSHIGGTIIIFQTVRFEKEAWCVSVLPWLAGRGDPIVLRGSLWPRERTPGVTPDETAHFPVP